ncbi:MAG: hypothetical protein WBG86_03060 [Polyangiales bacterium]
MTRGLAIMFVLTSTLGCQRSEAPLDEGSVTPAVEPPTEAIPAGAPIGEVSDVGGVAPAEALPAADVEPTRAWNEGASPDPDRNAEAEPEVVEEYDVGEPAPKQEDVVEPLPKKTPIAPSGVPIEGPSGDPIEGPQGVPIDGPRGVPIEGPRPQPIDGSQVDQEAERWTD